MNTYIIFTVFFICGCAVEATQDRRLIARDADLLADQDAENDGCSELFLHSDHPSCDEIVEEEARRNESLGISNEQVENDQEDNSDAEEFSGQAQEEPSDGADMEQEAELPFDLPDNPEDEAGDEGSPIDPNIVEFRIPLGTGSGSWNTEASIIVAEVGQTIRFFNDDNRRHRLHTNGLPCPHGDNFEAGESFDCLVIAAYDGSVRGPLYDHNDGPSAEVWIRTTTSSRVRTFARNDVDEMTEACPDHP